MTLENFRTLDFLLSNAILLLNPDFIIEAQKKLKQIQQKRNVFF